MLVSKQVLPLSEFQFQDEAKSIWEAVYTSECNITNAFRPELDMRMIIWNLGFSITSPSFGAIMTSITNHLREKGDEGFFVSVVDRPSASEQKRPYHWYVPIIAITEFDEYLEPLEYQYYSTRSDWGLWTTSDEFAVFACNRNSNPIFSDIFTMFQKNADLFIEDWLWRRQNLGANLNWIPTLLAHIYGNETAKILAEKYRLMS
jgi:hypothetical protein